MKVPKARKLPSGKWFIQLRLGGQSVPVTAFSEKAVRIEAERIKAEYRAGYYEAQKTAQNATQGVTEGITIGEAVNRYIDARRNVKSPATIRGYDNMAKTRWQSIAARKIGDIKPSEWQGIVNIEAGTCGPKTIKNAWGLLRAAIKEAAGREPPKVSLPQVANKSHPYLTAEQIPVFVAAVKDTEDAVPALLALSSLRLSEILALRWENIPPSPDFVQVAGAVVPNSDGKLVFKETNKNAKSARKVPILIPELKAAIERDRQEGGPVLAVAGQTLRKRIDRICRDNGLPEVGVHGLRHSFASLAYSLGVPERVTMDIGGWTNLSTVHKIYTHISQSDISRYQGALAAFYVQNANKNANATN